MNKQEAMERLAAFAEGCGSCHYSFRPCNWTYCTRVFRPYEAYLPFDEDDIPLYPNDALHYGQLAEAGNFTLFMTTVADRCRRCPGYGRGHTP